MEKISAIILAAGKGTRMNEGQASPIPKVMFQINGKPMIYYSIQNIKNAGVERVVLVVGYKHEMVEEYLVDSTEYVLQEEQLGTGHAVMVAEEILRSESEAVLVCYGDMPLFKPETIRKLISKFAQEKPAIAMLSVILDDPEFWAYGRIVRDESGEVVGIVEQRDCAPEQLSIKESNPGFYIFEAEWLWQNISKLNTNNAQGEYYLTDMVKIATEQGKKIIAIPVSEESEALGINTQEQLREAENVLRSRELTAAN